MNIQYNLDWERTIDPYRRNTGGQTVPTMVLVIGDNTIHVVVEQDNPGETGVWTDEFLNVTIALPNHDEYGYDVTPDADAFEEYIKSPQATALLQRIADGYSTDWSGRQPGDGYRQAVLDQDATVALAELESAIADLPTSTVVWWNVEEWFGQVNWHDLDGDEVDDLIANPADDPDIGMTGDPAEYIMEEIAVALTDELYLTNTPANVLTVRGIIVVVQRDCDGDVRAVVSITTPAGNHRHHSPENVPIAIQDIARGFGITPRRARALAKNRHQKYGIGQQLPGGQWIFSPEDLGLLRPDPKYKGG